MRGRTAAGHPTSQTRRALRRRGRVAAARVAAAGQGSSGADLTMELSSPRYARLRGLQIPNAKYTCNTGQTRSKLLEQWVHLTNLTAGQSRPGTTHLAA